MRRPQPATCAGSTSPIGNRHVGRVGKMSLSITLAITTPPGDRRVGGRQTIRIQNRWYCRPPALRSKRTEPGRKGSVQKRPDRPGSADERRCDGWEGYAMYLKVPSSPPIRRCDMRGAAIRSVENWRHPPRRRDSRGGQTGMVAYRLHRPPLGDAGGEGTCSIQNIRHPSPPSDGRGGLNGSDPKQTRYTPPLRDSGPVIPEVAHTTCPTGPVRCRTVPAAGGRTPPYKSYRIAPSEIAGVAKELGP